ncbi:nicotinate-nucleotide adenylyltransferase [Edaphobacter aggregans]|uniref:nicotinate-nucleotide adenylyltransferase n=1 Tax=Edaphobacter aggregans TaxID=570835 RepID=UPI0005501292|nr:nicotinate-nucleotide adenylyltransferase [Edaphobacter aggregans]
MRVALFGGTFDPPHRGHIGIARAAADNFGLDTVLFAPAGQQPLKTTTTGTPFPDRLAMVELACADDPRFTASTLDAPRPDSNPNYTVDTLATLRSQLPGATLYNLVGADSFLSLRHWREPERLLELAEWIVASRPGYPLNDLSSLHLTAAERARVHLLATVAMDISATVLRERLAVGDRCRDLLPPEILSYIQAHGLYR